MISSSSATSNHNIMLEPTTDQSPCETVLERTIVEAFVKMIVCRQVTVQTISAKDGQVLESKTKLEEDQPVVLKVNKHEMTNYMSSNPFFSPATSARSSTSVQSSNPSPSTARPTPQPPRTSQASSPNFSNVQKSPASLFLQTDNLVASPELLQAMAHLPTGFGQGSSAQHQSSPRNTGGHSSRHTASDGQVTPRSLSDRSGGQASGNQHLVGKSAAQETSGSSNSSWHAHWQSSSSTPFNLNSDPRDPSPGQKPSIRSGERPRNSLASNLYLEPVEVPRSNPKETMSRSQERNFLLSSSSDSATSVQITSPRCSQVTSSQVDSGGGGPVVVVKIEDDDDVPVSFPPSSSAFPSQDRSSRDGAGFTRNPQQCTPVMKQQLRPKFPHQQPQPEQMEYGANAWYSTAHTATTSSAHASESDYVVESDLMVMAETSGQPESLDMAPQSLDSMMQGLQEAQAGYGGETLGATSQQPMELKMATGMEKTHFISPELVNRWTCRFCNRSLPSYGSLVTHMKSHNPNRPFQCTFCKKTFAQSCVLKTHIRTHTGEKPYVCSQCGKGFAQAGHLASHKKFHSGIRPFVCTICSKRFIQKSDLVKHSKIHLRESLVAAGASTSAGPQ